MTQTPLVSIIIPTFNRAHLIGETLDSVLAQTYQNWECIVVDDGSTDDTDQLMASYCAKDSRFQYHHRPADRLPGGNAARNYGFEVSKGEYVQWFDSDDVMLEEFIYIKIKAFSEEVSLVICSCCKVDFFLNNLNPIILKLNTYLYKDYVLWDFKIVTNNIIFRRSFLMNDRLFLEYLYRGQEAEFLSRIFYNLPITSIKIINIPLFYYRQHNESISSRNKDYIPKYKLSEKIYLMDNYKRSIEIKDKFLISIIYKRIIKLMFLAIDNKDFVLINSILKDLKIFLLDKNNLLYVSLVFYSKFSKFTNKGRYVFKKHFLNYNVIY